MGINRGRFARDAVQHEGENGHGPDDFSDQCRDLPQLQRETDIPTLASVLLTIVSVHDGAPALWLAGIAPLSSCQPL